jgi:hypothetical protein
MKPNSFLSNLSIFLSAILVGCHSPKPVYMLPPNAEVLENIPMESNASVLKTADVKAYPIGRYIDPRNKDVLHEQHIIYRRERPETWRLYNGYAQNVSMGPNAISNPVTKTSPNGQELTAELNRQRLVTEQLLGVMERANSGDQRAQELMRVAHTLEGNNKELLKRIESYNASLQQLRTDVDTIKTSKSVTETPMTTVPPPPEPPIEKPIAPVPNLGSPKDSGASSKNSGWGLPILQR